MHLHQLTVLLILLALLCPPACSTPTPSTPPATPLLIPTMSYLHVLERFDAHILRAERQHYTPDAQGAMTRNQEGYISVKFQMGLTALANYAIVQQDSAALADLVRALEYTLSHQQTDGGFALSPPPEMPATPRPIDQAGTASFFLSDLGVALATLAQSPWYQQAPETHIYRQHITNLAPNIHTALDYLLDQQDLLRDSDQAYANRLLFHALAYYSLGHYLERPIACETGRDFLKTALALQAPEGYFAEKRGYDSSYNGVSLYQGMMLLNTLPSEEPLRLLLWEALLKSGAWQASRVLPSGEISTVGNTRVYPGGEMFMDQEKKVAWSDTVKGFLWLYHLSQNSNYNELAKRVEAYYRR